MKKLITIICAAVLLVSCNKEDRNENVCPTMQRESIPSSALNHFDSTYVGASNVTWFNVDSKSICAVFDLNNNEYEVIYNNAGGFVSEEIELENEQEGKHEDATDENDDEEGCECDRESEHED
jgi:major membrane immunogen (membrane-anchored lipoprotein)